MNFILTDVHYKSLNYYLEKNPNTLLIFSSPDESLVLCWSNNDVKQYLLLQIKA